MVLALLLKTSLVEDEKSPKFIVLNKETTKIGRKSEVCIDTEQGKQISKHHSTIYRRNSYGEDIWIIEDNHSLNGTFVNKRKIHRVSLREGDEIVFGAGAEFVQGDLLESTDNAPCRYSFFIPFPPIKFLSSSNPNKSICPSEQCEECPICMGPLTNPETLPCHHTFCLHCIRKWAKVCNAQYRTCACPMCRAVFHISSLSPEEAIVSSDLLQIISTEPFLRDIHMTSCKKVRAFNIFKKWTEEKAKEFWETYKTVHDNRLRCALFFHLTKVTVNYILTAPRVDLQQAVENLSGKKLPVDRNALILELLTILQKKLMPPPPIKVDTPRPQKPRYYYY